MKGGLFLKIVGIICEYNPFHKGHKKQFDIIRSIHGPDTVIVCLMSGNYVQRGAPAVYNKMIRAEAALLSGADLVLELPVTASISSAEGFAAKGVAILSPICDYLCFGTESNDLDSYMQASTALLTDEYSVLLKEALTTGISFPAARQTVLKQLNCNDSVITNPNDILAVEYCKAIIQQNSKMQPMPIHREGNYHAPEADFSNPSATSLRTLICDGCNISAYTTDSAASLFSNATVHSLKAGERAMLAKLRSMTESDFSALPYGSEGLWRKFMHAVAESATIEDIISKTKSKRYTRTRIDRMIMCAYLGITKDMLEATVPYVRILGFNYTGRKILRSAKERCLLVNIGEVQKDPYQCLESLCTDLYGLFAESNEESSGAERQYRIIYIPDPKK